jgi:hypothetical protein
MSRRNREICDAGIASSPIASLNLSPGSPHLTQSQLSKVLVLSASVPDPTVSHFWTLSLMVHVRGSLTIGTGLCFLVFMPSQC